MPLPKERSLSQEVVMCLVDATEQSIERLRRELERKITIRARRSKNYHMIVIKTGLGRARAKIRFAQHLQEALLHV